MSLLAAQARVDALLAGHVARLLPELAREMRGNDSLVILLLEAPTTYYLLLTTYYLPLTTYYLLLTTHYSQLTTYYPAA